MKQFKEFNIDSCIGSFIGAKISINDILNKDISIHKYDVGDSKFKGKKLITIQIKIEDEYRVIFTSSINLEKTIEAVPKDCFPFKTSITKNGGTYAFN